jgi:hypothetical protein
MNTTIPSPRVTWIERLGQHPLCDIPWYGKSVVLSDGNVHFCCFSDATIGNVHQVPYEQLWNGSQMQRIRQTLVQQQFPIECRSPSCPIYSQGHYNSIDSRMEGVGQQEVDSPYSQIRDQLARTTLKVDRETARAGQSIAISLEIDFPGPPQWAQLYVALTYPSGEILFLPDAKSAAVPLMAIELAPSTTGLPDFQMSLPVTSGTPHGRYELCAALFASSSSPGVLANCYWAEVRSFEVL